MMNKSSFPHATTLTQQTCANQGQYDTVTAEKLADILRQESHRILVIDSRSFLEYNTHHVKDSYNVCCSKLVKRRLQHDKITIQELLAQTCQSDLTIFCDVVVYDQCSSDVSQLSDDCFLSVLMNKLVKVFLKVTLLEGGFLRFQANHPSLCESKAPLSSSSSGKSIKYTPLTSISQPCMPVSNIGPTKVLPFLYLGSQLDAMSQDTLSQHGIGYILNISTTCPMPSHILPNNFCRIPVNDNYSDKLLPYFNDAFQFIDKVRQANGSVLVHCLAGISRSPTIAIAYVMKHFDAASEEAYKYVKDKRPTVSPNFNFLGQLMEFEKQLKAKKQLPVAKHCSLSSSATRESPGVTSNISPGMKRSFSLHLKPIRDTPVAQSPTTAMARLNFDSVPSPTEEMPTASKHLKFPQFPTTSLDQLSFTPCFTKKDQMAAQSVAVAHSVNNNNGSMVTGGTKRPLSTSGIASTPEYSTRQNNVSGVVYRSPENKAKRPLVRPNSIAYSSYPKFENVNEYVNNPANSSHIVRSPGVDKAPASTCSSCGTPDQSVSSQASCFVDSSVPVRKVYSKNSKLSRKSQSLEDILNSDEPHVAGTSGASYKRKQKHCVMNTTDLFSQTRTLDKIPRSCRGPSDSHQSSSSISSSGSHASLQGSLELIPVS